MLEIVDIHKSYENQPLLNGTTFNVAPGETVCLLGASGSGKSTLLRIIAGLESPEKGQVCWAGENLASTPTHRRRFGLMFQDYALFPHLTVAENVAFGLRMQGMTRTEVDRRTDVILSKVNLSHQQERHVTDLSGGEQQRVALARALAPAPRLLMLDEPLGALDRTLRDMLMLELRGILHATGVPAIYVTHDQEEAFALAGRVLLLHAGQIVRSGTPAEVWAEPGSAWAARFLGLGNLVEGTVQTGGRVLTAHGTFNKHCLQEHAVGENVTLLLRPFGTKKALTLGEDCLQGRVVDLIFHQDQFKVILESGLFFFLSEKPALGEVVTLQLQPGGVQCLHG